jgi:hypothetical protein
MPAAADVCLLVRQLSGLIWSITQPTIWCMMQSSSASWLLRTPGRALILCLRWIWCFDQGKWAFLLSHSIWAKQWIGICYTSLHQFSSHSFQELREICSLPLRTYSRQSLTVPLCTKQTHTTNTHVYSSLFSFEVEPSVLEAAAFMRLLRAAWGKPLIYSACVIMSSNSIHCRIEISNALNAGWRWIETLHACML